MGGNAKSDAGGPAQTLVSAFQLINKRWGNAELSRLYQTPAFPAGAGPDFVNAACAFYTEDCPQVILNTLHDIELQLGRERNVRWGQRTLDLDLIGYDDVILPNTSVFDHWHDLPLEEQAVVAPDALILPHPRVQDRSFVLVPLADVAADWVHPRLGQTTLEMLNARPVSERDAVVALKA